MTPGSQPLWTRRGVILGSASVALAGCGTGLRPGPLALPAPGANETYRNDVIGYGALVPDPRRIFDLPAGFSYQVISREGEAMDDGFLVPNRLDGMGAIDIGGGQVALVRNHELSPEHQALGPTGGRAELAQRISRSFDQSGGTALPGGTTTLIYDYRANRPVASWLSLSGTVRNCAGGVTPWGSWLSCEETVMTVNRPHGWVFEVPAGERGLVDPVPLRALGRFNHEAAIVDPSSGIVYLTEDRDDGLFYRLIPSTPGRLVEGGRLQALVVRDGPSDTRNWASQDMVQRRWFRTSWVDLQDVESPADDLRQRGRQAGAASFARGEGIHIDSREIYFTCTSGGPRRLGQLMRYQPGRDPLTGGRLQIFSESDDRLSFANIDNIAISPWNHVIMCEDKVGPEKVNHLKGITPEGEVYTIGRNAHPKQAELAGVCFSPDGRTMFVNIYSPGMTLAISGPWRQFSRRRMASG